MLMLTDRLEWWARRFQRAGKRTAAPDARRTEARAAGRRTDASADELRADERAAPRSGRFTRRALQER
jgi:hypothetical protein